MTEKTYFYRKLFSQDFEASGHEKTVIPVRLKNKFFQRNVRFDSQAKKWLDFDGILPEDETHFAAEFVETPVFPKAPAPVNSFSFKNNRPGLEDLSPSDMKVYLNYRRNLAKANLNAVLINDQDLISKDYFGAVFESDDKALTFRLTFLKFDRAKNKVLPELPEDVFFSSEEFFFSIKDGEFSTNIEIKEGYSESRKKDESKNFSDIERFFKEMEVQYPKKILSLAYEKLLLLTRKFTKLKLTTQVLSDESNKSDETRNILLEMYKLLRMPFEPNLYPVIFSREFQKSKRKFSYNRKNSRILKKFLRKMKLKDYRTLRKCFAERPETLLTCLRLKDAGFKDLNLFNRVIENSTNREVIDLYSRESLVFFSNYSIKKRGEIATMNTLLRGYEDLWEADDAMRMFADYFKHIPEELRKDVLTDGFTHFNHDALSNLTYRVDNENYTFEYTKKQKSLEDDIDGYEFRLPETSWQMCEIGTALHNCVASYAKPVRNNECTIVYARKDGEYKICIELRETGKGYTPAQERIDRNASPTAEQKKILNLWHEKHRISQMPM
ncbi:MAG: PcfJ domain-containing protein [Treponema sp.]|nr:PcfJ domain-containing protein [Treponema sp.]